MKLLPREDLADAANDQSGSVQKIMDGTLRAISSVGARRLSMSDISEASNVSRGTLYRYFCSKEEVLASVSEYVCSSFEKGIVDAGEGVADPIERFRAVMRFFGRFTVEQSPEGMFETAPAFHLNFLRAHFGRHKAAVRRALGPVFEYFDERVGRKLNHDLLCDTLVRLQLSTLIIPATPDWLDIWNRTPDELYEWAMRIAEHQPRNFERTN